MSKQILKRLEQVQAMATKEVVAKLAAGESPVVTFSKIADWNRFLVAHNLGSLRLTAVLEVNEAAVQQLVAASSVAPPVTTPIVELPTMREAPVVSTLSGQPVVANHEDAWAEKSTTVAPPKTAAAPPVVQGDWE